MSKKNIKKLFKILEEHGLENALIEGSLDFLEKTELNESVVSARESLRFLAAQIEQLKGEKP